MDGRCRSACRASVAPLNFVSDFPIKSAFWPKFFSSPAAGLKGLRLACGGFATLASTIIPVGSGDGVTSPGRLAAAAVVIQAFYRGQVDRRLASGLAAAYLLFLSTSTRLWV